MKHLLAIAIFLCCFLSLKAQNIYQNDSLNVTFDAANTSSPEEIKAVNKKATVYFDSVSGEIACIMNITDFVFKNALMQEHFNENYMDSDQYPTATFSGTIKDFDLNDIREKKSFIVDGEFEIHGVKRQKKIRIELQKTNQHIELMSHFKILLEDFKVKIPKLLFYKFAKDIEISIDGHLKK